MEQISRSPVATTNNLDRFPRSLAPFRLEPGVRRHGMGLRFSPDGSRLAALYWQDGLKRKLVLWDVSAPASPVVARTIELGINDGQALAYAGEQLLVGGYEAVLVFGAVGKPSRVVLDSYHSAVQALAVSPAQDLWLAATTNALCDCHPGDRTSGRRWEQGTEILQLAFSPDGRSLATISHHKGDVTIWNVARKRPGTRLRSHAGGALCVAFSPQGLLASGGMDHQIVVRNAGRDWTIRNLLEGHRGTVSCVAFSPDGSLLVSASASDGLRVWDPRTGAALGCVTWPRTAIVDLAFSANGRYVAALERDGAGAIWETTALVT